MTNDNKPVADHRSRGDLYALIVSALRKMSKSLDTVTIDDLASVDHVHARGLSATVELADQLPVKAGDHVVDIGCGLGGPARYMANRFQCHVSGVDITQSFVDAAVKLTALLGMEDQVTIQHGDGQQLPYGDARFDGGYTQHVTMNVPDRERFFAEAHRVLKNGAWFALTEHALGPMGNPHHPVPWAMHASGSCLMAPSRTRALLEAAGFGEIVIEETGAKYIAGYRVMIDKAEKGMLPPLSMQLHMGETTLQKLRNAARNIEEGRTQPIKLLCRKK